MTLTEFLLARIAEDETVARAGISSQADPENGWGYGGFGSPHALTPHVGVIHEEVQALHIIRWHPARVLAECEAKRRIVEDFEILHADYRITHDRTTEARRFQALVAVGQLAIIYSDHSDYDETWRP
jgi:Family of unknown function (DUF6221)